MQTKKKMDLVNALNLKIEYIREYKEHGCDITGDLIMVRYYHAMKGDPRFQSFGSNLPYRYIDKAKELAKTTYPDCETMLSMPDLVCRI